MEITDIKFRHVEEYGRLKALVSVTFDDMFAVHDIKIIDGHDRLFLAMPSRRMPDGRFPRYRASGRATRCATSWSTGAGRL